jgi:hypothetical protein
LLPPDDEPVSPPRLLALLSSEAPAPPEPEPPDSARAFVPPLPVPLVPPPVACSATASAAAAADVPADPPASAPGNATETHDVGAGAPGSRALTLAAWSSCTVPADGTSELPAPGSRRP